MKNHHAVEPVHHLLTLAGLEVHVAEWGAGHPETVVLWHGLARTGRDFDPLARALAGHWRLLVPDTPGRGLSQWATDPAAQYSFAYLGELAAALCEAFKVERMRWVGTSMGGALGMRLAGGAFRDRITRLVVNDIGPELPAPAVQRIVTYVSKPPTFATLAELEAYLRTIYQPFGFLPETQWRVMTMSSARRRDDGRITLHYDPQITAQIVHHPDDYELWEAWDRIIAPTLVLRGATSDMLLPEVAAAMTRRGPRASLHVEPGCGHAPPLNVPRQIDPVRKFLVG